MFKKFWLKFTDKEKYDHYKLDLAIQRKINILKGGLEKSLNDILLNIENKENISFFHSGHLGDIAPLMFLGRASPRASVRRPHVRAPAESVPTAPFRIVG